MIDTEKSAQKSLLNNSLLIGGLAGLGFAIGAWGIESIVMVSSHGTLPFVKLLAGGLICILIGMAAGWLTKLLTPVLANVIVWACTAAVFSRITLLINFQGMQTLLTWLDPETAKLINYSVDYGVSTRATLMLVIIVVFGLLAGLLVNSFVEEASVAYPFRRWSTLLLWTAAFFAIALLSDSLNHKPMRDAIKVVNNAIQFQLEHADENLPVEVQVQTGMRGLRAIAADLDGPYSLIPASYDQMLVFIKVLVKLEDSYALCSVINNTMGTCMVVESP